jgi:HAD superfamily hydrolase (TIGR01509 family)
MTDGPALVIFDCDGVLVDSEPISARCVASALGAAGYGIDEAQVLERFLGLGSQSMCAIVEGELGRPLPGDFLPDLRRDMLAAFERELRPIEGAAQLLDRLEMPRCVASSSHPERIRRSLEITGLKARLAPHLFSATMVDRGKPAPDLFLYAAGQMAVAAPACVVVEDSEAGVRAGKAAGMTVVGFTGGSHVTPARHGPKLESAGADVVIDAMTKLGEILPQCGRSFSPGIDGFRW